MAHSVTRSELRFVPALLARCSHWAPAVCVSLCQALRESREVARVPTLGEGVSACEQHRPVRSRLEKRAGAPSACQAESGSSSCSPTFGPSRPGPGCSLPTPLLPRALGTAATALSRGCGTKQGGAHQAFGPEPDPTARTTAGSSGSIVGDDTANSARRGPPGLQQTPLL